MTRGGIVIVLPCSPLERLNSAEGGEEVYGREGEEGEEIAEKGRYGVEVAEKREGGGEEEGEDVVDG